MELGQTTKVVVGAGSITGFVAALLFATVSPAIKSHLDETRASSEANIRQDVEIKNLENRIDGLTLVLKDIVRHSEKQTEKLNGLEVQGARIEQKLDSWEPNND